MAQITLTRDYSTGTPASLSAVNYDSDREELQAGINDITNAQINASAAIVASKLDLTSPGAIGSTAAGTGAFSTLAISGATTLSGTVALDGVVTTSKAVDIVIANTVNDTALTVTQADVTNNPIAVRIDQDTNATALEIDSLSTIGTAPAIKLNQTVANDSWSFMGYHGGTHKYGFSRNDDVTDAVCFKLGRYFLWVDTTGDLRIKSDNPTSDTDGTIIGTQS